MPLGQILTGTSALNELGNARRSLTDPNDNGLLTQARRAVCDAAATTPGQIASILSPVASGIGSFCQPYYDQNGDDPPSLQPPFQGGQCSGIYRIRTVRSNAPPGTFFSPTVEIAGPIVSITYNPNPVRIPESGAAVPTTMTVTNQAGQSVSDTVTTPGAPNESISLTPDVRLRSGAPDTCGDPPPVPAPSPNYSRPRPVGIATPINIDGDDYDITVSPQFNDLSNNPYVVVDVGGIEIPISLTNPATDPVLPSPPQPPARPGNPTDSPAPSGTAEDEPTPEEEDNGIETIGYAWNFPETPSQQPPIPGTNPGRFPVIVGNLQLRYRNSEGQTFWSENYIIREQSGSLIRPDESLVVTGVSWQKNPLWPRIVLTPLKRQKVNNA